MQRKSSSFAIIPAKLNRATVPVTSPPLFIAEQTLTLWLPFDRYAPNADVRSLLRTLPEAHLHTESGLCHVGIAVDGNAGYREAGEGAGESLIHFRLDIAEGHGKAPTVAQEALREIDAGIISAGSWVLNRHPSPRSITS